MRRPNDEEWTHLVEDGDVEGREEWMDGVSAVFYYFAERTPGSYIEKQAMTVVGTGRLLRMVVCGFFSHIFSDGLGHWPMSIISGISLQMAGDGFSMIQLSKLRGIRF